jgi:ATP-dependent RNA helicase RhlE
MPPEIQQLANALLHNPSKVEVTPVSSTVDAIEQRLYYVDKGNKPSLLLHMLEDTNIKSALVFTRTKHGADKLVKILQRERISAAAIHGNKSQNNRQSALLGFKSGELRVLVATDIAARGIDIDALGYVVNYELPDVPETYVHRIGRTGRAGATGIALTFCDAAERIELRDIQRLIGKSIPVIDSHPFPAGSHVAAPQVNTDSQRPFVQRGNGGQGGQQNRNGNGNRNGNSQGNRPQRGGGQQRQDRSHSGRPQQNRPSNHGQQRQGNPYNSQHSSTQRAASNQQPVQERSPWQPAQPVPKPQPQVGNIDLGEVERW